MHLKNLHPPKRSVLAGIGAEAFVGASISTQKPAATVGRWAAGGANETGDSGGETLPESGA